MTDDWDGRTERRAPVILSAELQPKNTVNAPIVLVLVGFAAVLLMQAASVWSHGQILQNQQLSQERDRQFSCYIVHTSQGEAPTNALTACGFLDPIGTRK